MTPRPDRGRLVALEGIDGAGKSTVQRRLAARWRARGLRVKALREPGDRVLGRLAQELGPRDAWASGMMFTLDRMLARPRLEGALATHDVVLLDRSFYSTLAYQGSALPAAAADRLRRLQRGVTVPPDRVVLLAIRPQEALRRLGRRGTARAPLERLRTLTRVDRTYRRLARGPRWTTVDAGRPVGEVVAAVERSLEPWVTRARRPAQPGFSSTSSLSVASGRRR